MAVQMKQKQQQPPRTPKPYVIDHNSGAARPFLALCLLSLVNVRSRAGTGYVTLVLCGTALSLLPSS